MLWKSLRRVLNLFSVCIICAVGFALSPSGRKRPRGWYRTRAKRLKMNVLQKIFICPFKKKIKKWNSDLTQESIPWKFGQEWLIKVVAAFNGLNYIQYILNVDCIHMSHCKGASNIEISIHKQKLCLLTLSSTAQVKLDLGYFEGL